jgi:cell division protein FtsL
VNEQVSKSSENKQTVTFFEQMCEFVRRNLSVFLLGGLLVLVIQDVFGTHGVLAMRRAQREAAKVKQEIHQIDTENQRLQDNVKSLKSDPQSIERIAREEIGLARPGEYVFKVAPKTETTTPSRQPIDATKKP